MDCGNQFIETFSDTAFYKIEALHKVIDDIIDFLFWIWPFTHTGDSREVTDSDDYCKMIWESPLRLGWP